jgi:Dual specificity phosphatase, catalytic domain
MFDYEEDYDNQKLQGEEKYNKKFIKRTKGTRKYGERYHPKSHEGNIISHSRCYCIGFGSGKVHSRILERPHNNLVKLHKVIDHKITLKPNIDKKASMENIVPYEEKYRNMQIHNTNYKKNSNDICDYRKNSLYKSQNGRMKSVNKLENNNPKYISLELLHPNIYLGNVAFCTYDSTNFFEIHNIKTILNVSGQILDNYIFSPNDNKRYSWEFSNKNGNINFNYDADNDLEISDYKIIKILEENPIKIYNFTCEDSLSVSYNHFKNFINKGLELLDENLERGGVLVVCNKGVNRSAAICSAYGMFRKDMSFSEVTDYIDSTKLNNYPDWNHLSNNRYRNLLRLLKTQEIVNN